LLLASHPAVICPLHFQLVVLRMRIRPCIVDGPLTAAGGTRQEALALVVIGLHRTPALVVCRCIAHPSLGLAPGPGTLLDMPVLIVAPLLAPPPPTSVPLSTRDPLPHTLATSSSALPPLPPSLPPSIITASLVPAGTTIQRTAFPPSLQSQSSTRLIPLRFGTCLTNLLSPARLALMLSQSRASRGQEASLPPTCRT
jgi:hypothetical protein